MDAKPEAGGRGEALTPKEMVLQGLIGCTGMDVAVMLEKQKVRFELWLEAEADQTEAHPKVFREVRMTYHVRAAEADRAKVERAVELSLERFCGVSAMLGKATAIRHELDFRPFDPEPSR